VNYLTYEEKNSVIDFHNFTMMIVHAEIFDGYRPQYAENIINELIRYRAELEGNGRKVADALIEYLKDPFDGED